MKTAWIRTLSRDSCIPATKDNSAAAWGLKSLGYEIKFYNDSKLIDLSKDAIVVGYVRDIDNLIEKYKIQYDFNEFPDIYKHLYKRNIELKNISDLNYNDIGKFIKPVKAKQFDSKIYDNIDILKADFPKDKCYVEDVINNISNEYRIFINNGKLVDVKAYLGINKDYDKNIVNEIATIAYQNKDIMPKAYSVDIGYDGNKWFIIELNDGYAIGSYELDCVEYAKFLETRFKDIFKKLVD